jgi:hypothetical protein
MLSMSASMKDFQNLGLNIQAQIRTWYSTTNKLIWKFISLRLLNQIQFDRKDLPLNNNLEKKSKWEAMFYHLSKVRKSNLAFYSCEYLQVNYITSKNTNRTTNFKPT